MLKHVFFFKYKMCKKAMENQLPIYEFGFKQNTILKIR